MTLKQVLDVQNNQIIINLPDKFKGKKKLMVTVDDAIDAKAEKILQIKSAASDPLFCSDVNEVRNDFATIDNEAL